MCSFDKSEIFFSVLVCLEQTLGCSTRCKIIFKQSKRRIVSVLLFWLMVPVKKMCVIIDCSHSAESPHLLFESFIKGLD